MNRFAKILRDCVEEHENCDIDDLNAYFVGSCASVSELGDIDDLKEVIKEYTQLKEEVNRSWLLSNKPDGFITS